MAWWQRKRMMTRQNIGKHGIIGSSGAAANRSATWRQRYGGRRNVISMAAWRQIEWRMAGVTFSAAANGIIARDRDAYLFRYGGAVSGGAGVKGVAAKPRWRLNGGIWRGGGGGRRHQRRCNGGGGGGSIVAGSGGGWESGGGGIGSWRRISRHHRLINA
jgi:hypothetical protein